MSKSIRSMPIAQRMTPQLKANSENEHKCTICPKKFKEKKYLNQHIKRRHQTVVKSGSSFYVRNVGADLNTKNLEVLELWKGLQQKL